MLQQLITAIGGSETKEGYNIAASWGHIYKLNQTPAEKVPLLAEAVCRKW